MAAAAISADDSRAMAASTALPSRCSESKASMISPLSSSSNMPVISAATVGWCLAIAVYSASPSICFCTEGRAAANAALCKGAAALS
eukprot:7577220-Lingulodinium_polyedra.AAC.1